MRAHRNVVEARLDALCGARAPGTRSPDDVSFEMLRSFCDSCCCSIVGPATALSCWCRILRACVAMGARAREVALTGERGQEAGVEPEADCRAERVQLERAQRLARKHLALGSKVGGGKVTGGGGLEAGVAGQATTPLMTCIARRRPLLGI